MHKWLTVMSVWNVFKGYKVHNKLKLKECIWTNDNEIGLSLSGNVFCTQAWLFLHVSTKVPFIKLVQLATPALHQDCSTYFKIQFVASVDHFIQPVLQSAQRSVLWVGVFEAEKSRRIASMLKGKQDSFHQRESYASITKFHLVIWKVIQLIVNVLCFVVRKNFFSNMFLSTYSEDIQFKLCEVSAFIVAF